MIYKRGLGLLFTALLIATGISLLFAGGRIPDTDYQDFENISMPLIWRVGGIPSGTPREAFVKLTTIRGEYKEGKKGLMFQFARGTKPVPIVVHWVLLRDMVSIKFWIKAKRETKWVVSIKDIDGAVFSSVIELAEDRWRRVTLKPVDFRCNNDSPVKKSRLDVTRLGYGYVGFDIYTVLGGRGKNTVFIDKVIVERNPYKLIKGNYILNGETKTIDEPTKIEGNIALLNNAELKVNAARFEVSGNIYVNNSTLKFSGGFWNLRQAYKYEDRMVAKNGLIELKDGVLNTFYTISGGIIENSTFRFSNVMVARGGFTFGLTEGCSLEMDNTKRPGEFIVNKDSKFTLKDCESVLIWLSCDEAIGPDLSLPRENVIPSWKAPAHLNRLLEIENSTNIMWGLIANPGCNLTIDESYIRAIGINYKDNIQAKVDGLKNDMEYNNFQFESEQHKLRFINTKVFCWNLYTQDTASLEIRDCVYGESISFGGSEISVVDSECDGTGGYLGAKDNSKTIFNGGKIDCNVLTHGQARFVINNCSVNGNVQATEESAIILNNSSVNGEISEIGRGRVERKDRR